MTQTIELTSSTPNKNEPAASSIRRLEKAGEIAAAWILLCIVSLSTAAFAARYTLNEYQRVEGNAGAVSQWINRFLVDPWYKWDTKAFTVIVREGYASGRTQFHPLFPAAASLLHALGLDPLFSLRIVSTAACLVFFYAFYRLARLDHPKDTAFTCLLFLVTFPSAYILFAPYSEPLFLLFAVLCLYYARAQRWWLSGFTGALAALTRQQGLFLIVPILVEWLESYQWDIKKALATYKPLLASLLPTAGYAAWALYRLFALKDLKPDFSSLQRFIYSVMISSGSLQYNTGGIQEQGFTWPWTVLDSMVRKAVESPDIDILTNLVLAGLFIIILLVAWKQMRWSYRAYSLLIFLVSFSYTTGSLHPVMGMPRHLLLAFPIFIELGSRVDKPWLRLMFVGFGLAGFVYLLWLHSMQAWVA